MTQESFSAWLPDDEPGFSAVGAQSETQESSVCVRAPPWHLNGAEEGFFCLFGFFLFCFFAFMCEEYHISATRHNKHHMTLNIIPINRQRFMGLSRLVAAGPPDPEHALKPFKAKACAGLKRYQNFAYFKATKRIYHVYLRLQRLPLTRRRAFPQVLHWTRISLVHTVNSTSCGCSHLPEIYLPRIITLRETRRGFTLVTLPTACPVCLQQPLCARSLQR